MWYAGSEVEWAQVGYEVFAAERGLGLYVEQADGKSMPSAAVLNVNVPANAISIVTTNPANHVSKRKVVIQLVRTLKYESDN